MSRKTDDSGTNSKISLEMSQGGTHFDSDRSLWGGIVRRRLPSGSPASFSGHAESSMKARISVSGVSLPCREASDVELAYQL